MPSNYLILCCPLLFLPSIFPSVRVFSSESVLCIRWPKYWSFTFSIIMLHGKTDYLTTHRCILSPFYSSWRGAKISFLMQVFEIIGKTSVSSKLSTCDPEREESRCLSLQICWVHVLGWSPLQVCQIHQEFQVYVTDTRLDQEFSPRARKDSSFHSVPCSDGYSLIYWAEAEGQTQQRQWLKSCLWSRRRG